MDQHSDAPRALRALLITGGTGFLGSNFLLSHADKFERAVAVVRGKDDADAKQRLLRQIETAARHRMVPFLVDEWSERLQVLAGDVADFASEPLLAALSARVEGCALHVWHFAATLEFEERQRANIEATNVRGTHDVLAAFARLGGERFVHVSTAYVAGQQIGVIPEQLMPLAGPFNNVYEESKCRAEWDVAAFCEERGLDYRIIRPAIVVGPLRNHRTGGSDSGLYGFVRLLHRMRDSLTSLTDGASVIGDPDTRVHLTPVDSFCNDALPLLQSDPGAQRIFHSVCPGSVTGGDLQFLLADELRLPMMRLVRERAARPAPIERVLDRMMALYGVAVRFPKTFERANGTRDHVGNGDARAYIRECLRELQGAQEDTFWEARSLASYDGCPLNVYAVGARGLPCVVLINAFGMTNDFFRPLAEELRARYRVITWDSRGIPSFAASFPEDACDIEAHARDVEAVLRGHGEHGPVHVVGWCTGAQVALRFRALFPERVRSIAMLNGAFSFPEQIGVTDFKRNIMYLMPRVARSRAHANAYHRSLYGQAATAEDSRESRAARDDRQHIEQTLLSSDQLVSNMTSAPFKDPETLYRYAKLVMHLTREPEHVWAEHVREPVLVVTGAHDTVAHPDESREIARRIPHAELVIGASWNHFSLLHERDFARRVVSFLRSQVEHQPRVNEGSLACSFS